MPGETQRMWRALRHRNYRLFFVGQSISLAGTWLTRFATVWMVYRLTKSPVWLGLIGFFGQAPAALMAPFAGVLVDRWDRRRTFVVTQIASMLQSAVLAVFALGGTMTVWHLLVLGAIQAVINAFDAVARQSFVREMLDDPADLPNAIALNAVMVNMARLLGPVGAALLVGSVGEGWCFLIDALSSLPVIASLFAMRIVPRTIPPRSGRVVQEMREALADVARLPIVGAVLLLFLATSVLAGSYMTLLPLVAAETFSGGPYTLGALMAASGVGALVGSVLLARRSGASGRTGDLERILAGCSLGLGVGFLLLELPTTVYVAAPILFGIGLCWLVQAAAANTVIQTKVDSAQLGRVMSLYVLAFFGGAPVGALVEGELAKYVGPLHTFALAGAASIVFGLAFARELRRLRGPVGEGESAPLAAAQIDGG